MAVSRQVVVLTTKTVLADSTVAGGGTVVVTNPTGSASPVYIGGDENAAVNGTPLATSSGIVLLPGQTFGPVRLGGQEAIHAIVSSTTTTVHVFRSAGVR